MKINPLFLILLSVVCLFASCGKDLDQNAVPNDDLVYKNKLNSIIKLTPISPSADTASSNNSLKFKSYKEAYIFFSSLLTSKTDSTQVTVSKPYKMASRPPIRKTSADDGYNNGEVDADLEYDGILDRHYVALPCIERAIKTSVGVVPINYLRLCYKADVYVYDYLEHKNDIYKIKLSAPELFFSGAGAIDGRHSEGFFPPTYSKNTSHQDYKFVAQGTMNMFGSTFSFIVDASGTVKCVVNDNSCIIYTTLNATSSL